MIRSILLPLAEGPQAANAREFALWLAKKAGTRIHILALIDVKAFEIPVLGTPDGFMPSVVTPPLQESQSLLDEMTQAARQRLEEVAAECKARDVACSIEVRTGIPAEVVSRSAVAHDMIVLARTGYSRIGEGVRKVDSLVPQVIRSSIRPVLVAGMKSSGGKEVCNVLVAFDGSIHAGRALGIAAELGARPGVRTTLVTISYSEDSAQETLAPAEAFLYHHGVTPQKKVAISSKPSDVICELVSSAQVDILIMGAYGHSPVREMLFGSTTERVLSHCGTTVILQS
jgi:nucleotide-binding universal stress UspA family protein